MEPSRVSVLQQASYLQGILSSWVDSIGIRIIADNDFDRLSFEYKAATGRTIYPVFDPERSDVCKQTGFVVRGEDRAGRVVHTQAFRLWNLENSNLTQHFERHIRLYCAPDDPKMVPGNTVVSATNCSSVIGRAVYHGQLWLHQDWRGQEIAGMPLGREVLPRIGILLALLSMAPDYLFCMSAYPTAEKGLISSYGFYHSDLAALTFRDSENTVLWHETVSYLSAVEIGNEVRRTLDRCAMDETARPFLPVGQPKSPVLAAAE